MKHGLALDTENWQGEIVAIPIHRRNPQPGLYRSNLMNEQLGLIKGRSWRKFVITQKRQTEQYNTR